MKTPVFIHNYTLFEGGFKTPGVLNDIVLYEDLDAFLADSAETKLAFIELEYFNPDNGLLVIRNILNKIKDITQVIVRSVELHADLVEFIQEFDLPNFVYYVCGYVDSIQHAQQIPDLYWLVDTMSYYSNNTLIDDKFDPYRPKHRYFDALYGVRKQHRAFVKDAIALSDHTKHFVQSEFLLWNSVHGRTILTNGTLWEPELIIDEEADMVFYNGVSMRPSQVIPFSVYNKAAYSMVFETNFDNTFSFYTEKTAKPLIAGRAFIMIAGPHYLRDLRRLGFKTFGSVIDESYDNILDNEARWKAAVRAAEKLIELPQKEVLDTLLPVLEHNKKLVRDMLEDPGHFAVERHLEQCILNPSSVQG